MKGSGYNSTVDDGVSTSSAICERLAATALVLKGQQKELRKLMALQEETLFPVDGMPKHLSSAEGLQQGRGTARHQNQATNISEGPSTQVPAICAWWKVSEYPRDTRKSTAKWKRGAGPTMSFARAKSILPTVQAPFTPDGQIWHCGIGGAEEHVEARKVLCGVARHGDESESDGDVQMRPLSDIFETVLGFMPEAVKNRARRAAFNARVTPEFVDWVEARARGRANDAGSPITATKACASAEWRDFYRTRHAKLLHGRPGCKRPTQTRAGRSPSPSRKT